MTMPESKPLRSLGGRDPSPPARNLSLLRLEEADRRVRRRLAMVRGRLSRAGVSTTVVEGSAIAAEVSIAEENLRRRAIRANLQVAHGDLEAARRILGEFGFRDLPPSRRRASATIELLKRASRDRRGAVHVIFDEELAPTGSLRERPATVGRPHPGSPQAAAERIERLRRYRVEPSASLERRWSRDALHGRKEEILEVGLVVAEPPVG